MKILKVLAALSLPLFLMLAMPVYTAAADPITNPTHFDDTYWYWPSAPAGYTSMDTNITPEADGSPDGYYFSAYYWFTGDYPATGGYLGLQTEGAAPTGKIAIFSIWGATGSNGPGYNASGTEGTPFYTARIPYPWVVEHTYDLNLAQTAHTAASNTWTATVTDKTTGVRSLIGNIVVPASRGNLYDVSNTFHERYSGSTGSCSSLVLSEARFTNLTANGGASVPVSHTNVAPSISGCTGLFATRDVSGGVESIVGGQFEVPSPTPAPVKPVTVSTSPSTTVTPTPTTPVSASTPAKTSPGTKPVLATPISKVQPAPKDTVAYTVGVSGLSLILLTGVLVTVWRFVLHRHLPLQTPATARQSYAHPTYVGKVTLLGSGHIDSSEERHEA